MLPNACFGACLYGYFQFLVAFYRCYNLLQFVNFPHDEMPIISHILNKLVIINDLCVFCFTTYLSLYHHSLMVNLLNFLYPSMDHFCIWTVNLVDGPLQYAFNFVTCVCLSVCLCLSVCPYVTLFPSKCNNSSSTDAIEMKLHMWIAHKRVKSHAQDP